MPFSLRTTAIIATLAVVPLAALAAPTPTPMSTVPAIVTAPQSVTTKELQRYIYAPNYPVWCNTAGQAAREMRVKPTTDPKTMHGIMRANIVDCAGAPYAQQHPALWNTAVFAASAAALIAARHEAPAQAFQDATHAKNWSADIAGFTYADAGASGLNSSTPSMYRTNAGRINGDAVALLNAIQGQVPQLASPADSLPAHAKGAPAAAPAAAASGH